MWPPSFLNSECLFISLNFFFTSLFPFHYFVFCRSPVPLCPIIWCMELDGMLPWTRARLKSADRMMDSFQFRASKTLTRVRAVPKLEGYYREGLGTVAPLGLIFQKWHLSSVFKRCNILLESCQDDDEKRKQWVSESQCGQRVRVKPGDLTSGYHSVAPFLCPPPLPPPHQPVLQAENHPPLAPIVALLVKTSLCICMRADPLLPTLPGKLPQYLAELKPWPQDPSGYSLAFDSDLFLSHCAVAILTSMLFLKCAHHIPVSGPLHFCSLAWNVLFQMFTWLTHSLISFESLIKCHLLREPFSDHLS